VYDVMTRLSIHNMAQGGSAQTDIARATGASLRSFQRILSAPAPTRADGMASELSTGRRRGRLDRRHLTEGEHQPGARGQGDVEEVSDHVLSRGRGCAGVARGALAASQPGRRGASGRVPVLARDLGAGGGCREWRAPRIAGAWRSAVGLRAAVAQLEDPSRRSRQPEDLGPSSAGAQPSRQVTLAREAVDFHDGPVHDGPMDRREALPHGDAGPMGANSAWLT
jgi:hypothetical protein